MLLLVCLSVENKRYYYYYYYYYYYKLAGSRRNFNDSGKDVAGSHQTISAPMPGPVMVDSTFLD
jgi:hypothetical protein